MSHCHTDSVHCQWLIGLLVSQLVGRSMYWSADWSVGQPIGPSYSRSVSCLVDLWVSWSVGRLVGQLVSWSVSGSTSWSVLQSLVSQSVGLYSFGLLVKWSVNLSANQMFSQFGSWLVNQLQCASVSDKRLSVECTVSWYLSICQQPLKTCQASVCLRHYSARRRLFASMEA